MDDLSQGADLGHDTRLEEVALAHPCYSQEVDSRHSQGLCQLLLNIELPTSDSWYSKVQNDEDPKPEMASIFCL